MKFKGFEPLAHGIKTTAFAGLVGSYVDDVATGATAAGGLSKIAGPVLGGVGTAFAVVDIGFAIHEVLQKDFTFEELEQALEITKEQVSLCHETSNKIHELHWNVINHEMISLSS